MDKPEATRLFEEKAKSEVERMQRYIARQAYSGRSSYTKLCVDPRLAKRVAEELEGLGYETNIYEDRVRVFWR
ncbi:MAG: hypothetical protein QNJ35_09455 [Paracoccaceae bacterium]|nr:hypothetical protein [Paracoccaceae bacterium]